MGSLGQFNHQQGPAVVMTKLPGLPAGGTAKGTVRLPQIIIPTTALNSDSRLSTQMNRNKNLVTFDATLHYQNDWDSANNNINLGENRSFYRGSVGISNKNATSHDRELEMKGNDNNINYKAQYQYVNNNGNSISTSLSYSSHELNRTNTTSNLMQGMTSDLHYNGQVLQNVRKNHSKREENLQQQNIHKNKNKNIKIKRRHSERILRHQAHHQEGGGFSSNEINRYERLDLIKLDRSHSFLNRSREDLPKPIENQRLVNDSSTSRSDTFIRINNNNSSKKKKHRVGGGVHNSNNNVKIGDTKALIDKYMNPEPVVYQSDLSFLYKDKSVEQVAQTIGRSFSTTWNKKKRTKDELNMLDLGNTYYKRKRSDTGLGNSIRNDGHRVDIVGVSNAENIPDENNSASNNSPTNESSPKSPAKRVLFNEETTEILDIHEIEPPFEFAIRVGRVDVMSITSHDSLVSTPFDPSNRMFNTTPPLQLKPILKRSTTTDLKPENINWADCYQYSSGEESDNSASSEPDSSYSYRDYLRDTTNGAHRLSLPVISASGSLMYSPSTNSSGSRGTPIVSPRVGLDSRSRSRSSNASNSSSSNAFQCSKEFALVLQNLDSDDEEAEES